MKNSALVRRNTGTSTRHCVEHDVQTRIGMLQSVFKGSTALYHVLEERRRQKPIFRTSSLRHRKLIPKQITTSSKSLNCNNTMDPRNDRIFFNFGSNVCRGRNGIDSILRIQELRVQIPANKYKRLITTDTHESSDAPHNPWCFAVVSILLKQDKCKTSSSLSTNSTCTHSTENSRDTTASSDVSKSHRHLNGTKSSQPSPQGNYDSPMTAQYLCLSQHATVFIPSAPWHIGDAFRQPASPTDRTSNRSGPNSVKSTHGKRSGVKSTQTNNRNPKKRPRPDTKHASENFHGDGCHVPHKLSRANGKDDCHLLDDITSFSTQHEMFLSTLDANQAILMHNADLPRVSRCVKDPRDQLTLSTQKYSNHLADTQSSMASNSCNQESASHHTEQWPQTESSYCLTPSTPVTRNVVRVRFNKIDQMSVDRALEGITSPSGFVHGTLYELPYDDAVLQSLESLLDGKSTLGEHICITDPLDSGLGSEQLRQALAAQGPYGLTHLALASTIEIPLDETILQRKDIVVSVKLVSRTDVCAQVSRPSTSVTSSHVSCPHSPGATDLSSSHIDTKSKHDCSMDMHSGKKSFPNNTEQTTHIVESNPMSSTNTEDVTPKQYTDHSANTSVLKAVDNYSDENVPKQQPNLPDDASMNNFKQKSLQFRKRPDPARGNPIRAMLLATSLQPTVRVIRHLNNIKKDDMVARQLKFLHYANLDFIASIDSFKLPLTESEDTTGSKLKVVPGCNRSQESHKSRLSETTDVSDQLLDPSWRHQAQTHLHQLYSSLFTTQNMYMDQHSIQYQPVNCVFYTKNPSENSINTHQNSDLSIPYPRLQPRVVTFKELSELIYTALTATLYQQSVVHCQSVASVVPLPSSMPHIETVDLTPRVFRLGTGINCWFRRSDQFCWNCGRHQTLKCGTDVSSDNDTADSQPKNTKVTQTNDVSTEKFNAQTNAVEASECLTQDHANESIVRWNACISTSVCSTKNVLNSHIVARGTNDVSDPNQKHTSKHSFSFDGQDSAFYSASISTLVLPRKYLQSDTEETSLLYQKYISYAFRMSMSSYLVSQPIIYLACATDISAHLTCHMWSCEPTLDACKWAHASHVISNMDCPLCHVSCCSIFDLFCHMSTCHIYSRCILHRDDSMKNEEFLREFKDLNESYDSFTTPLKHLKSSTNGSVSNSLPTQTNSYNETNSNTDGYSLKTLWISEMMSSSPTLLQLFGSLRKDPQQTKDHWHIHILPCTPSSTKTCGETEWHTAFLNSLHDSLVCPEQGNSDSLRLLDSNVIQHPKSAFSSFFNLFDGHTPSPYLPPRSVSFLAPFCFYISPNRRIHQTKRIAHLKSLQGIPLHLRDSSYRTFLSTSNDVLVKKDTHTPLIRNEDLQWFEDLHNTTKSSRQYFHTRTGQCIESWEADIDSDDEVDDEWVLRQAEELISGFEDVSDSDKRLMILWNRHVHTVGLYADRIVPRVCVTFVRKNHTEFASSSALQQSLLLHLLALWDYAVLDTRTLHYCMRLARTPTE